MTHSDPNNSHNLPAVHLKGVSLLRGERLILNNVSWRVDSQQFAAILGPNGSGKSTIARLLMGYLWPTRGNVTIHGRIFGETDINDLREDLRMVQPNGQFDFEPTLSVREVVRTGYHGTLGVYRRVTAEQEAYADEMIERVGLRRSADNVYGNLSTGERVRTLVARALVSRPKLLILDEATSGLDIRGREELLFVIDELSYEPDRPALITITHHVEELPRATTNVLLLDDGAAVAAGAPADVLTGRQLSEIYGCPVEIRQIEGRFWLHAVSHTWKWKK